MKIIVAPKGGNLFTIICFPKEICAAGSEFSELTAWDNFLAIKRANFTNLDKTRCN